LCRYPSDMEGVVVLYIMISSKSSRAGHSLQGNEID
jgi:hypothetical protein